MTEYRNPTPTADILIIRDNKEIVLVERRNEPYGWAIPGGFVDEGEYVENAAVREALEETGLNVRLKELFYVYSDPKRDARLHSLSTVFIAEADRNAEPKGGDDAKVARYFSLDDLPEPLCFDHARIIEDLKIYLKSNKRVQLERYLQNVSQ